MFVIDNAVKDDAIEPPSLPCYVFPLIDLLRLYRARRYVKPESLSFSGPSLYTKALIWVSPLKFSAMVPKMGIIQ